MSGTNEELQGLTEKEQETYKKDMEAYLKADPYLNTPFMMNTLRQYETMKIYGDRLRTKLLDPNVEEKDKFNILKQCDTVWRTMALYANRMGITYVSRQRKKETIERKTPLELLEEKK